MDRKVPSAQVDHGKSRPFVMIRDEYLFLTGEDACAAALLAVLENWTNSLSKSRTGRWITRSHRLLSEDMLGLYSGKRIASAVKLLVERGYVLANVRPKSTSEFRLDAVKINEALRGYVPYRDRLARDSSLQAKEELPQAATEKSLQVTEEHPQPMEDLPKYYGRTSDTIDYRLSNRLEETTCNRVKIDRPDTLDLDLEGFLESPERIQESKLSRFRFRALLEELAAPWDPSSSEDLSRMIGLSWKLLERDLREAELEELLGYVHAFIKALKEFQVA